MTPASGVVILPISYYRHSPGSIALGACCRSTGAPLPFCSYVTRGLCVVDRTVGACPITCSPRHLTSHLFHSYISTIYSLPSQACIIYFLFLGRYRLRAWVPRQRDSHRLVALRVGLGPRLTMLLHFNKN